MNIDDNLFNFIDFMFKNIHIWRMKRLPTSCPSCEGTLAVRRLSCNKCETEVEGLYSLPPLAGLAPDEQEFILEFIKASGSLKDMASLLGVSYPTVRNRLDEIIGKLRRNETKSKEKL
jgi:hypothetical protein